MHKVLVNHLVACQGKSVVRLTDRLNMTIAVDWDVKPQTNKQMRCAVAPWKRVNLEIEGPLVPVLPETGCCVLVHDTLSSA